jgi:hypothetical protein
MQLASVQRQLSKLVAKFTPKQLWIAAGVSVACLLIVTAFAVPAILRTRAQAALASRTGLNVSIDDVSLAGSGASLRGVRLVSGDPGVDVSIESVDAKFSWSSAPFAGTKAITGVHASGVDAEVDIASQAFLQLKDKLRKKPESEGSGSGGGEGGSGRTLEATRISLTVKEGSQELLVVDNASAELTPAAITANVERLRASKPGLASAALSGVDVQLSRAEGLQIERVKVADGLLSIHTRSPQPSANPAEAAAEPDDDAEQDDAAVPTPAAIKNPVDGDRKKSLLAALDRLTPDAVITLQRARIERVTDRERVPVLNDVECELSREAGGALRITGKGATDASGKLNIDMKFWPADLRADGRVTLAALPLTLFVPILPRVPWYESEKSRIDAELTISAESPAQLSLEGYANLKNVGLSAERIATSPVQGFAFSIAGKGHWFPAQRRLEIESGSVGVGKAKANVKGAVELDSDHYAFDVSADLPPTNCNDAVHSIPSALLGDMSVAEWRGNIAGKLRFHTDSRELDSTELKFDIKDKCDWRLVPVLADLRRFSRPFVHSVTEPDGTVFEMETGPGTESWTPIEAMSPYLVHAVLVHEDPQFFNHKGFSPINIRNALVRDLRERRYAVGASTISMQLVKNVFLHREKTLARKIQEVLLTWWTERVMDKRDMIELYLNVIEYGPGIYGIRNAAKHYWNREPSELSPAEGVFIATILPNPKRYHAYYQKNAIPSGTLSNMRKFLSRLGDRGAFDKEATEYGLHELEHFRFARDSKPAEPRAIAGTAALLPYQMQAAQDVYDTDTFGMRGVN